MMLAEHKWEVSESTRCRQTETLRYFDLDRLVNGTTVSEGEYRKCRAARRRAQFGSCHCRERVLRYELVIVCPQESD